MLERKMIGDGSEVTVTVGECVVTLGINGKSHNSNRHAVSLTPGKARELAELLNAAARLA